MARCRSCGAPIIWGKTTAGKPIPLDEPEARLVRVRIDGDGATRLQLGSDTVVTTQTYVSHFATCPNADEHRRRG